MFKNLEKLCMNCMNLKSLDHLPDELELNRVSWKWVLTLWHL